jgi:glycerophosphoryl diester phosphodiesterase
VTILLDADARPVIAHRGASAHAPENTMPAFERAVAAGAHALELDVRVSADGRAMVIHDATLHRTTGGAGDVAALPAAAIHAADAGARFTRDGRTFPFRGQGVRVPTIDEVLERFPAMPLLIEVKVAAASGALERALERFGAAERCLIGAFDVAALEPFRARGWRTCASQPEVQRLIGRVLLRRPLGGARYDEIGRAHV